MTGRRRPFNFPSCLTPLSSQSYKTFHQQELEAMKARLAAMEADAAKLRGEEVSVDFSF